MVDTATVETHSLHTEAVFPPTDEPTLPTLVITVILLACFTVGIAGNASQLALQIYTNRFALSQQAELSQVTPQSTFNTVSFPRRIVDMFLKHCVSLYVILITVNLCGTRALFSASVAKAYLLFASQTAVIIENLVNMWMFGMVTCASHFVLVTSGRAVIGWILVFIVVDQVMLHSQFWSQLKHINHRSAFIASLVFLFIFACLIVTPSLFFIKPMNPALSNLTNLFYPIFRIIYVDYNMREIQKTPN
uniref:G_PROTEIN_RECEP_F1_2 domain-containing protein n=1 Tax=Steinernema glaseri TaxID=37863 RepID=A0A1I7ZHS3_9BILA